MSRFGYADPPYPGCAHLYAAHPDYAGEVDQVALIARLEADFDGWILHTSSTGLAVLAPHLPKGARIGAWVKPFAAFKRNVSPAYAWEPVIFKPMRKAEVHRSAGTMRDWVSEPITMKRGLTGAKPEAVCWWAFEIAGAQPDDEFTDLFPGSGAVGRAWNTWKTSLFPAVRAFAHPRDRDRENGESMNTSSYKHMTPTQQAVFERIATGEASPSYVHPKTLKALLRRALIVRVGETRIGRDRFGTIAVPAYEVPMAEHMEWCAWCSDQQESTS